MEHRERIPAQASSVYLELTSREFLQAFGDEVGVVTESISTSREDGQDRAQMLWEFSTQKAGIPALARKFLSSDVRLTWEQSWLLAEQGASGELTVILDGRPSARTEGQSTLQQEGAESVLSTSTSTKSSLPRLVGASIETTIDRELVGWILSVQARVLRRRLASG